MTISNQTASITYTGNGVQTVFTYNFLIPYQSDWVTPAVAVYTIEDDVSTLLAPSEYTITGVGEVLGGTVTYSPAISSSVQIQINRALLYTQPDAFPNQGFLPQTVEDAMDNIVMMIQQLAAALGVTVTTQPQTEDFAFALTNETTAITVTGQYVEFVWPYDFTISEVIGSLTTASSSGTLTMTVKVNGTAILSTPVTLAVGEKSSLTAATQPVVSSPSVSRGDVVSLWILAAGTTAAGAKLQIVGRQT